MRMAQVGKVALAVVVAGVLLGSTTACERRDEGAQGVGRQLDRAGDKISDTVNPKGPAEKLGRDVDRATDHD